MAHRHFEGKAHAMIYAKYRPVPPQDLIQRVINFIKEKYSGNLDFAVDVGCGSGQSTQFYAPYFTKVLGTDVSGAQIGEATQNNSFKNVTFKVSEAETIPVEDNSVQLISASQAAHWFDLERFYKEGKRALCPGGVMALIGYDFPKFQWNKDPSKNAKLYEALDTLYAVDLKGYWAPERKIVDQRYVNFVIPYNDFIRHDDFYHDMDTRVSDVVHYCSTWSGYQNFCKINGDQAGQDLIKKFQDSIMSILGVPTSPEETIFTKRTKFFLLLARKPCNP